MPLQPLNYFRDYSYLAGAENEIDFSNYNPFSVETQAGYRKYQSHTRPDILVPTTDKSVISNGVRRRIESLLNHEVLNGLSEGFKLHTWSSKAGKEKFFYQVSRRRDYKPITVEACEDIDLRQVTAINALFQELRQQYSVFIDLEPNPNGLDSIGLILDPNGDLLLNSRNLVSLYARKDDLVGFYRNHDYLARLKAAVLNSEGDPDENESTRVLH
jgi:hypothetical protein